MASVSLTSGPLFCGVLFCPRPSPEGPGRGRNLPSSVTLALVFLDVKCDAGRSYLTVCTENYADHRPTFNFCSIWTGKLCHEENRGALLGRTVNPISEISVAGSGTRLCLLWFGMSRVATRQFPSKLFCTKFFYFQWRSKFLWKWNTGIYLVIETTDGGLNVFTIFPSLFAALNLIILGYTRPENGNGIQSHRSIEFWKKYQPSIPFISREGTQRKTVLGHIANQKKTSLPSWNNHDWSMAALLPELHPNALWWHEMNKQAFALRVESWANAKTHDLDILYN